MTERTAGNSHLLTIERWILLAITAAVFLTSGFFTAALVTPAGFGYDPALVQRVLAAYAVALTAALIVAALRADRWGLGRTLKIGLWFVVFGWGFSAIVNSATAAPWMQLVLGSTIGIGTALVMAATFGVLAERSNSDTVRRAWLGQWAAIAAASTGLGLVVGSLLTGVGQWGVVIAVEPLVALIALIGLRRLPASVTLRSSAPTEPSVWSAGKSLGVLALISVAQYAFIVILTQFFAPAHSGFGEAVPFALVALAIVAGAILAVRSQARSTTLATAGIGLQLLGVLIASLAVFGHEQFAVLLIGLGIAGVGLGSTAIGLAPVVAQSFSSQSRGRAGALNALAWQLPGLVGAWLTVTLLTTTLVTATNTVISADDRLPALAKRSIVTTLIEGGSVAAAVPTVGGDTAAMTVAIEQDLEQAFLVAMRSGFLMAALLLLAAVVLALHHHPTNSPHRARTVAWWTAAAILTIWAFMIPGALAAPETSSPLGAAVDRMGESMKLALTRDATDRAALQAAYLEKRLDQLVAVAPSAITTASELTDRLLDMERRITDLTTTLTGETTQSTATDAASPSSALASSETILQAQPVLETAYVRLLELRLQAVEGAQPAVLSTIATLQQSLATLTDQLGQPPLSTDDAAVLARLVELGLTTTDQVTTIINQATSATELHRTLVSLVEQGQLPASLLYQLDEDQIRALSADELAKFQASTEFQTMKQLTALITTLTPTTVQQTAISRFLADYQPGDLLPDDHDLRRFLAPMVAAIDTAVATRADLTTIDGTTLTPDDLKLYVSWLNLRETDEPIKTYEAMLAATQQQVLHDPAILEGLQREILSAVRADLASLVLPYGWSADDLAALNANLNVAIADVKLSVATSVSDQLAGLSGTLSSAIQALADQQLAADAATAADLATLRQAISTDLANLTQQLGTLQSTSATTSALGQLATDVRTKVTSFEQALGELSLAQAVTKGDLIAVTQATGQTVTELRQLVTDLAATTATTDQLTRLDQRLTTQLTGFETTITDVVTNDLPGLRQSVAETADQLTSAITAVATANASTAADLAATKRDVATALTAVEDRVTTATAAQLAGLELSLQSQLATLTTTLAGKATSADLAGLAATLDQSVATLSAADRATAADLTDFQTSVDASLGALNQSIALAASTSSVDLTALKADVDRSVTTLAQTVDTLSLAQTVTKGDLAVGLAAASQTMAELRTLVATAGTTATTTAADVTALRTELADQLTAVQSTVTALTEGKLDAVKQQLQAQLAALEGSLVSVAAGASQATADVSTLKRELTNEVTSVRAAIGTANAAELAGLRTALTAQEITLQGAIDALDTREQLTAGELAGLRDTVTTSTAQIHEQLAATNAKTAIAQAQLAGLATAVRDDLAALETSLAAAHQATVGDLRTETLQQVARLDQELATLDTTKASAADLLALSSGLHQQITSLTDTVAGKASTGDLATLRAELTTAIASATDALKSETSADLATTKQALQTQLDTLTGQLAVLAATPVVSPTELALATSGLQGQLTTLSTGLTALSGQSTASAADLAALRTQLTSALADLTLLQAVQDQRFVTIETTVADLTTTLTDDLATVTQAVGGKASVTDLQQLQGDLTIALATLTVSSSDTNQRISDVAGSLSQSLADVSQTLNTAIASKADTADVSGLRSQLSSTITSTNQALNGLDAKTSTLSTNLTTLQATVASQISALTQSVDGRATVTELQTLQASLLQELTAVRSNTASVATDLTAFEASTAIALAGVTQAIATATAGKATSADVTALADRLDGALAATNQSLDSFTGQVTTHGAELALLKATLTTTTEQLTAVTATTNDTLNNLQQDVAIRFADLDARLAATATTAELEQLRSQLAGSIATLTGAAATKASATDLATATTNLTNQLTTISTSISAKANTSDVTSLQATSATKTELGTLQTDLSAELAALKASIPVATDWALPADTFVVSQAQLDALHASLTAEFTVTLDARVSVLEAEFAALKTDYHAFKASATVTDQSLQTEVTELKTELKNLQDQVKALTPTTKTGL